MHKFFRKYHPTGCWQAWKWDQIGPRCIQKRPQRASKTTLATREIPRGSPGGGPRSQRRPRGQRSNFGYPRGFFGGPQETPWGSSGGAQIVLFDMHRQHWPPKWRTENQKFFQRFFMKSCKKHCFFNAKPLSTPARTPSQGGLKIGPAAPKYC